MAKHLFQKGQSGNPGGRKKGSGALSAFIKKKTKDCRTLAEWMLQIAENCPDAAERIRAMAWLTDRAIGKVADAIKVSGELSSNSEPTKVFPFKKAE